MAVSYKLRQDTRKGTRFTGKWYARAVTTGEAHLDTLAEAIEQSCTATKADILAVITQLVIEMRKALQDGKRVVIDGFGSFKIGLHSKPADSVAAFAPQTHISGLHVIFRPDTRLDANRHRTNTFVSGCKVEELQAYNRPKAEKATPEPPKGAKENAGSQAAPPKSEAASHATEAHHATEAAHATEDSGAGGEQGRSPEKATQPEG